MKPVTPNQGIPQPLAVGGCQKYVFLYSIIMVNKLKECLDKGECNIILYTLPGCPHCSSMKHKLDTLELPYITKDANLELVEMTGIQTAPQVHIITKDETKIILKPSELDDFV